ncbi:MAG: DUF5685 family protein [Firmicutes bacterium]|nr:DUF5685 family protein [Bacillota bacterium]
MFGYLDIEKETLQDGQRGLWQTFMCGLCMSTKQFYGNFPRAFISNDVNLFNVLFHSVTETDVAVEQKHCFSHPFKKRPILCTTGLTDSLAAANILLTYWNVYDDVVDGNGTAKRTLLKSLKKAYSKAKNALPQLDETLSVRYDELRKYEQSDCNSLDRAAHSFALLSQQFCKIILGDRSSEHIETLCYNLGKWIYLIDALDDAEKDVKKHNYNVFVKSYGVSSAKELSSYVDEIKFEMYSVLNRIAQSFNDLNLSKYVCILKNVLFESIRNKTESVLAKYN